MTDCFDEQIAAAMQNVPVPPRLGERLLVRLAAENQGANEQLADRPTVRPIRKRARWIVAAGGLLATAATLFVAVWLGLHRTEALSEQYVLDEAIQTFDSDHDAASVLLARKPAPADYPLSLAVQSVRGVRWRTAEGLFLGRGGVVYDMPSPDGTQAVLYVADADGAEGFSEAPDVRPFTTAGCCASAWIENGLLYVLVVRGEPAAYRAYLNLPQGPMA